MVWASDIKHYITHSKTFTHDHQPIQPEDANITRFGLSCQIAKSIVQRLNQITDMQGNRSDEEWEIYRETLVENYADELIRKCDMIKSEKQKAEMEAFKAKLKSL
ncbi:uncharacterized protein MELLADRAFT_101673 [Melampsora larici-populina 98AG31]|uniref:Uncharacterized protein n=1 Tax=Melampsora larici-populina (strain 98AG31 / pathotype 3-4-7) TaxID=747676 RepID=F4R6L6_MELLP|nr:uncharacterized protein MELLADRAFT_101673 [Melampsora larici-populina 98AG31]EGG12441.1 hypothetical protein MELLADRAFT_101673 [Melampsora larici-populina 98AG31]